MAAPSPHRHNTSRSTFTQRLTYFLVGVATGLIVLAFVASQKQRAAEQDRPGEPAAEANRDAPDAVQPDPEASERAGGPAPPPEEPAGP